MSMKVFDAALEFADQYSEMLTLGGGEPTLHPQFDAIFGKLMIYTFSHEYTLIVTNGTDAKRTLSMLRMNTDRFCCEVSLDRFHDNIDEEVAALAIKLNKVRDVSNHVLANGRGKNISGAEEGCACEDLFVTPNGDVFSCMCKVHKYGNVLTGVIISEEHNWNECGKTSNG